MLANKTHRLPLSILFLQDQSEKELLWSAVIGPEVLLWIQKHSSQGSDQSTIFGLKHGKPTKQTIEEQRPKCWRIKNSFFFILQNEFFQPNYSMVNNPLREAFPINIHPNTLVFFLDQNPTIHLHLHITQSANNIHLHRKSKEFEN